MANRIRSKDKEEQIKFLLEDARFESQDAQALLDELIRMLDESGETGDIHDVASLARSKVSSARMAVEKAEDYF